MAYVIMARIPKTSKVFRSQKTYNSKGVAYFVKGKLEDLLFFPILHVQKYWGKHVLYTNV